MAGPSCIVLALGSPHGDDRVAWDVVDRLANSGKFKGRTLKLTSPFEIAAHVDSGLDMIVIDACRSDAPPGCVVRLDESEMSRMRPGASSTHGGSLVEALHLARALGRQPHRLTVLAVEIESGFPNTGSTKIRRKCEDELWRHLCAELTHYERAGAIE
jgi:hydrogenase maturation protease